jgi:hypothetical protein
MLVAAVVLGLQAMVLMVLLLVALAVLVVAEEVGRTVLAAQEFFTFFTRR